ncbi:hypothetical protein R6Z07F_012050 [Ovis aries]
MKMTYAGIFSCPTILLSQLVGPEANSSPNWLQVVLAGFNDGSDGKESACNEGDTGSIPGSGRLSGEGNGNPVQYSCMENPMDRGVWWASPWSHKKVRHN